MSNPDAPYIALPAFHTGSNATGADLARCQWCGAFHHYKCPMVKAFEYFENGMLKKVEFHP